MNTKIVYVVTSSGKDIYVEQTYMSIWSCHHHNPKAKIFIVTDKDSIQYIDKYPEIRELTTDIISVDFDSGISKGIRSRSLKTSLRSLIKGDFLYVDGDTIFCDSISEIDDLPFNLALIEDSHADSIYKSPVRKFIISPSILLFNKIPPYNAKFYNGGVIYAKDNEIAHSFFKEWHNNWQYSKEQTGYLIDQPGLFQAYLAFQDKVKSLDGIYNAQIERTDKFLKDAKILHFLHGSITGWHPFIDKEYYKNIKENNGLTEKEKNNILNCKQLYNPAFLSRRFSFLPSFVSKPLRKINRFYKFKILNYYYYLYYKMFYKHYSRILEDSKLIN